MKYTWIQTSDKLPELFNINDYWQMSSPVLCYYEDAFCIGCINYNQAYQREMMWIINDSMVKLSKVSFWLPLERPALEDMRDTQNYTLNT